MAVEHSRGLLLAEGVTGRPASELEQALHDSRVTISVETEMPASQLTARVLLTTLRRSPGQLILDRGGMPGAAVDDLAAAVSAVDPERPLAIAPRPGSAGVRLHVGAGSAQAIRVVPEGYGAHVAGIPKRSSGPPGPATR